MKYIITTAIDYTNDVIHLGHVYQKILADFVARKLRKNLGNSKVRFVTGTDEFGQKVQKTAQKEGVSPKNFVDSISKQDKYELDCLQISYDRFIRTTDLDHQKTAQDFFKKSYENGFIYESDFVGKYCEGCEEYKTETNLVEGKCPFHPTKDIIIISEKNYFFKQSAFREKLKNHFLKNQNFVVPRSKFNEMFEMIDNLSDIPVTRKKESVSWGIECPIDPSQVIYVWFDALINYYTFAGEDWDLDNTIIHFLGKDNTKFHALLWPAMLFSIEEVPPSHIYAHSFLSIEGRKISKSLGNSIKPSELLRDYSSDTLRYYMLKFGPIVDDTDFSIEHLKNIYNGELANGYGNTISRVFTLARKFGVEFKVPLLESETNFENQKFKFDLTTLRPDKEIEEINQRITQINKEINETEPWKISNGPILQNLLQNWLLEIFHVTKELEVVMPETTSRIIKSFESNFNETNFFPKK
jgi:methionyl-tRNA synthetase